MEPPQVISQIRRSRENNLRGEIQALRNRYGYSPGYRPIHAPLIKKGTSASLYLVRKVMKLAGFFGLPKKRKYPKGNYSLEIGNLIKGNFQSATPHQKWFIDINQKRYLSGIIYLAAIKDAATRVVAGYATSKHPNSDLVVLALITATSRYASTGTIIHSDMESVFKSEHYRKAGRQVGLVQSMGNAGLSFANQMIESFFGKIKTELLRTRTWKSYEEINNAITYYCESFYNCIRPQVIIGGRTPLEEFHGLTTCTTIQATLSVA